MSLCATTVYLDQKFTVGWYCCCLSHLIPHSAKHHMLKETASSSPDGQDAPVVHVVFIAQHHGVAIRQLDSAATLCQAQREGERRKSPGLRELRVCVRIFRTQSGESGSSHCLDHGTDINSHMIT